MAALYKTQAELAGVTPSPAPAIRMAHRSITRRVAVELSARGIDVLPFRYVYMLLEEDGISQVELAERLDLDRATVTVQLDSLEKIGILVRKPHPTDRRKTNVFLTARGRRLKTGIYEAIEAAHQLIFRGISASDLERVRATLEVAIESAERSKTERTRRRSA
jgi:DNA-binding MarR family transcriptional regulator